MEFCCAGSLCREGVNIEEELSKIKDADRYEAVTTYMAGLFSQNPSIEFLTTVRHIAENFLLLLGNDQRDACIQTVYRSILKRSDLKESKYVTILLSIPKKGEFTLQGSRQTQLLVEALKVSSDRISPQPTIKEMIFADPTDRAEVDIVTQFIQLQRCHAATTFIEKWERVSRIGQMSLLVSSLENHSVILGRVVCETKPDYEMICSFLSISSLQSWTIDHLEYSGSVLHQTEELRVKKGKVIQLKIGCWIDGVLEDEKSFSSLIDCLSCHGVEEIKIEKVNCMEESSLDRLSSLLSILTLQSWTIDELKIEKIENPWRHLAKASGQGSIKSLTVGRASKSVKNWVKEEVESFKISIAFLHFDYGVRCETDEEVKTLCTVLDLAKKWRVDQLLLSYKMGSDGWEALSKVVTVTVNKVGIVSVSKLALRAANNQQVAVLWHATDGQFMVVDYDDGGTIAKKSEGATGLEKLLAYKSGRNCQLM